MNPNRQTIDNPTKDPLHNALRGVPGREHLESLQARNQSRARAAILDMGRRYCCHPAHSPQHVERAAQAPVPGSVIRMLAGFQ